MKNIVDFILEGAFGADSKVRMGDAADLLKFLKTEIEGIEDPSLISVTGDGIKYNKILVPDTKLSLGLTAGEYADIFVNWLNDFNDKKNAASSHKVKIKRLRKNFGVPRGSYGAKERMDARAKDRNNRIMHGQPLDDAEIYRG